MRCGGSSEISRARGSFSPDLVPQTAKGLPPKTPPARDLRFPGSGVTCVLKRLFSLLTLPGDHC
eukprot:6715994-Pyramimonas_sp.AAC.1